MGDNAFEYGTFVMTPLGPGTVMLSDQPEARQVSGIDAGGQHFREWFEVSFLQALPGHLETEAPNAGDRSRQQTLDAMGLQTAIDSAANALVGNPDSDEGHPTVRRSLLENHLAALLGVQRTRAKGGLS